MFVCMYVCMYVCKRMENQDVPALRTQDVQHVSDKDKAQALADQFISIFTKENLDNIPFTLTKLPTVVDITVTTEGVLKLFKRTEWKQSKWSR